MIRGELNNFWGRIRPKYEAYPDTQESVGIVWWEYVVESLSGLLWHAVAPRIGGGVRDIQYARIRKNRGGFRLGRFLIFDLFVACG